MTVTLTFPKVKDLEKKVKGEESVVLIEPRDTKQDRYIACWDIISVKGHTIEARYAHEIEGKTITKIRQIENGARAIDTEVSNVFAGTAAVSVVRIHTHPLNAYSQMFAYRSDPRTSWDYIPLEEKNK